MAVAVPSAALICAAVGLQPRVSVVPVAVITGAVMSTVQVTVRATGVAALAQASVRVHVRVWERPQPALVTVPSAGVGVTLPQASVAVAVPSAASICAAVGLQPSVSMVPVAVITGAMVSLTVMTCEQEAGLPQASVADQVRVMTLLHEVPGLLCVSKNVTATEPSTASLAVMVGGAGTSAKQA